MPANTLSSFTVGVQYAMDERSERNVAASFDRIKKGALAITSALTALSAVTIAFAKGDDEIAAWGEMWGLSVRAADAWAGVFERSGSTQGSFRSLVEQLASLKAGIAKGEGEFYQSWARSGLPAGILAGNDPQQWLSKLADHLQRSGSTGRINAAGELGLDHMDMRVFQQGGAALMAQFMKELGQTSITNADVEAGRELNDQMQDFTNSLEGLTRAKSRLMRGPLGEFIEGMTALSNMGTSGVEKAGTVMDVKDMFMDTFIDALKEKIGLSTTKDTDQGSVYIDGEKAGAIFRRHDEKELRRQGLDYIGTIG